MSTPISMGMMWVMAKVSPLVQQLVARNNVLNWTYVNSGPTGKAGLGIVT